MNHYGLPDNKVMVVDNGVDPDLFYPMQKDVCRETLKLDQQTFYVGFVGSFEFYHDVQTMLAAYKSIASKLNRPLRYLMVGDGALRQQMQNKAQELGIADNIDFIGAVPNVDVARYINASDVMVSLQPLQRMKQLGEASSLKVKEYLACDAPVIIAHVSGQDYPFAKDACLYIKPESSDALIDAVVKVASGAVQLCSMRDDIVKHGSWSYSASCLHHKMELMTENDD